MNKVLLREKHSQEILLEAGLEDIERLYQQALFYEENGIETEIIGPTITETLANSLGVSEEEKQRYAESVAAELHDHEGVCGSENQDENKGGCL